MEKVVVFGAGDYGKKYIEKCPGNTSIVGVVDNNWMNMGNYELYGYPISDPNILGQCDYDKIIIALSSDNFQGIQEIKTQLNEMGIQDDKIVLMNVRAFINILPHVAFRASFFEGFGKFCERNNIQGDVAECGVDEGLSAVTLNTSFSKSKLYLFDTFAGNDVRDIQSPIEQELSKSVSWDINQYFLQNQNTFFCLDKRDIILLKMPNKSNVIFKKGYIPDTFAGLENNRFIFVNLDLGLYEPTMAALRFFSTRMVEGGIIWCCGYYGKEDRLMRGSGQAILDFANESGRNFIPIGNVSYVIFPF